jgi:hypothetical protein
MTSAHGVFFLKGEPYELHTFCLSSKIGVVFDWRSYYREVYGLDFLLRVKLVQLYFAVSLI